MLRTVTAMALAAVLSTAPFQCSGDADPSTAIEETPAEALYTLAEEFKKSGDTEAWTRTLKHLIVRYPSSRFATVARSDLAGAAKP